MSTVTMPSPCVSSTAHALAPASVSTRTMPVDAAARARDVHGDAADAVAAHLGDRSVGVEDAHADVAARPCGAASTRSTPSAPTPNRRSQSAAARSGDDGALVVRVDDDEVVAQPLVLEKLHGATPARLGLDRG